MRSSSCVCLDLLVAMSVLLESSQGTGSEFHPALFYGEHLCANTESQASHSSLIELEGNRTSCVVSVADEVTYHVSRATIEPRTRSTFDIADVGRFVLTLASGCGMDPCYVIEDAPQKTLVGSSAYVSPGVISNRLAYITVYDCKDRRMLSSRAEVYEASDEVVNSLLFIHGIRTTLEEIKSCVDSALQESETEKDVMNEEELATSTASVSDADAPSSSETPKSDTAGDSKESSTGPETPTPASAK